MNAVSVQRSPRTMICLFPAVPGRVRNLIRPGSPETGGELKHVCEKRTRALAVRFSGFRRAGPVMAPVMTSTGAITGPARQVKQQNGTIAASREDIHIESRQHAFAPPAE